MSQAEMQRALDRALEGHATTAEEIRGPEPQVLARSSGDVRPRPAR